MANLKYVLDGNGNKVYPITIANGVVYIKDKNTQIKLSDWIAGVDKTLSSTSTSETVSKKADKVTSATEGHLASLDKDGNLADSGKSASDFATSAQGALADSALQKADIATGTADGNISVDGTDVAVKGLGSAAYTASDTYATSTQGGKADSAIQTIKVNGAEVTKDTNNAVNITMSTDYDAKGAADTVKEAVIGDSSKDTKDSDTINGAKKYADDAISTALSGLTGAMKYKGTVSSTKALPTEGMSTGDTYAVAEDGTYDGKKMEVGDYLVYNGTGWDGLNGENQVSQDNTELVIGTAVQVATVDGTTISVKQVEDTTKLECEACGDTNDYDDVSSLFTTKTA